MQKFKDYIYYNRKEIIIVFIFFLGFIFLFFYKNDTSVILENEYFEIEKDKGVEINQIMIDIKGEVKNPGTYQFNDGFRIIDAIEKSGGLTDNACVDNINLSEKLKDEMVLYIPSKVSLDKENTIDNIKKESFSNVQVSDGKISINNGTLNDFMTLSGIGKKKAEAIIEYREKNGLFKNIQDITKVNGIGNSIFEKIKDHIKL